MVTASPRLYPHMELGFMFIMVGLAQLDVTAPAGNGNPAERTVEDGMIPHIVFSDEDGYFPGPDRWQTAVVCEHAPLARTLPVSAASGPRHRVRKIVDAGRRLARTAAAPSALRSTWPGCSRGSGGWPPTGTRSAPD